ncbi:MAG: hypothetical protein LBS23_00090, partial [Holosporaceae bacterium]|jgi:hypothetical protein|nr:hypothetical protein [Holosporaceae bacterium]
LTIALKKYGYLLDKIRIFWGVSDSKNLHFYCFYSRADHLSGTCLANFIYGNDIYAMVLMCGPSLVPDVWSLNEHLGIIAHEFSHAMCDAAYEQDQLEKLTLKFKSPNAIVAGWFLNEALAIVLGNGLFKEAISKTKVNLKRAEYCAKGFAPALYDLVKCYFDNSKTIDEYFIESAVKIFDKVYPNGYTDPNIYLYHVYAIYPDDIKEHEIISKLSKKTIVSSFYYTPFSKLTNNKVKDVRDANSTIMVIFRDKKQLKMLNNLLPPFNDKRAVNLIHKNKRTYVLIKIDDKHSLEDCINELFSRANN